MATRSASPLVVPPELWRLWAKWPRDATVRYYHPVICHLVDVASAAQLMWERALTRSQRAQIALELQLSEVEAHSWVSFWAGLHDLGKASPAFQTQLKEQHGGSVVAGWLRDAELHTDGASWQPHGAVSVLLLEEILSQSYQLGDVLSKRVAALVGAHHGLFFSMDQLNTLADERWIGDTRWAAIQMQLAKLLADAIGLPDATPTGLLLPSTCMLLAGYISVADWVGSNADQFTLAATIGSSGQGFDLRNYAYRALQQAAKALDDMAWDSADLTGRSQTFESLFPGKSPRPVQQKVIELAHGCDSPGLALIEVPMGEGKTEAAMYLADAWSTRLGTRGAYIALPTQATSNQMFGRVAAYLDRRFHDHSLVNLHLAHGMAALEPNYESLKQHTQVAQAVTRSAMYDQQSVLEQAHRTTGDDVVEEGATGAVIAATWFASAKRTLLASYGVGTIDQSLLAVLQVKHVFVRLFGLSGKTIILDEVHAYDMYMSTLMERLLHWLGALGAPVVLLSATLPAARRQTLIAAYAEGAGWPIRAMEQAPYPRVTYLLGSDQARAEHVPSDPKARPTEPLRVHWMDTRLPQLFEHTGHSGHSSESFTLADELRIVLRGGGCVAVVCNTVRRAQATFEALSEACGQWSEEERPSIALLHARMPFADRQQREAQALSEFGLTADSQHNPARPRRMILVATQVIEQSLDLDFDLMVTDLAPVDLLLQRAGRLQRHRQNDPYRPPLLREPCLWIASPDGDHVPGEEDGTPLDPAFDRSDEFIYSPHILLRSWYALHTRETIAIPGDIESLIAFVYDEGVSPPTDEGDQFAIRWITTYERDRRAVEAAKSKALAAVILPPTDEGLLYDTGRNLEEDAPGIHQSLQAQTRDGDPSLSVVLLEAPDARSLLRARRPSLDEARALLGRSLSLSHRGLVQLLLSRTDLTPSGWAATPWLRHHRLIALDAAHQATFGDGRREYMLTLDTTLGLKIESRKVIREE